MIGQIWLYNIYVFIIFCICYVIFFTILDVIIAYWFRRGNDICIVNGIKFIFRLWGRKNNGHSTKNR